MKRLFFQLAIFVTLVIMFCVWVFSQADGYTDAYYLRFTTPEQSSMIIGVSKSAQGLQPNIFNEVLNRNDMYNYSFNAFISPFGKTYLESIKRKLDKKIQNGIFIITFDAWSLGSMTSDPNDSNNFREVNLCLNNSFVSFNPNIPYLMNFYEGRFIDLLRQSQSVVHLHEDGWLEVSVSMDSVSRAKRLDNSVDHYNKIYTPYWKYSSLRFEYLKKTIQYLKKHGKVFLVRLPVHPRLLDLENKIIPDLDEKIYILSENENVNYLNFTNSINNYEYTDGIHLGKESGAKISREIASWILQKMNE
jgi:hypothetical protein